MNKPTYEELEIELAEARAYADKQLETVTAAFARHNALRKMGYTGEPIMLLEDVKKLIVSK